MLARYDAKINDPAMSRDSWVPGNSRPLSVFYPVTPTEVALTPMPTAKAAATTTKTATATATATTARPVGDSLVLKKLAPGVPGARRLAARFGDALVCVRYREDADGARRFTTVELVVETRPLPPGEQLVRIAFEEAELRARVKQAGGTWDPKRKLWRLPRAIVRKLKLTSRVIREPA